LLVAIPSVAAGAGEVVEVAGSGAPVGADATENATEVSAEELTARVAA
jgi:hypothetical protein